MGSSDSLGSMSGAAVTSVYHDIRQRYDTSGNRHTLPREGHRRWIELIKLGSECTMTNLTQLLSRQY